MSGGVELLIDIADRVRAVRLRQVDAGFVADVDGRRLEIDARAIDGDRLSMLVRDDDGRQRSVDVSVRPLADGQFEIRLRGRTMAAAVRSGVGPRPGAGSSLQASGPQKVVAPMPGRVVRVLVAAGDTVAPRSGLVVVEAMKMENELRAARAGRVKDVLVTEGQLVDAGALLVTVE